MQLIKMIEDCLECFKAKEPYISKVLDELMKDKNIVVYVQFIKHFKKEIPQNVLEHYHQKMYENNHQLFLDFYTR